MAKKRQPATKCRVETSWLWKARKGGHRLWRWRVQFFLDAAHTGFVLSSFKDKSSQYDVEREGIRMLEALGYVREEIELRLPVDPASFTNAQEMA